MKRIIILLLALLPIIAEAQDYIRTDETTAEGRFVETKPYAFFSDGKMYLLGFSYSKGKQHEAYIATVVSTEQRSAWEVKTGEQVVFKMADGDRISLKSLIGSSAEPIATNDYTITSSYIIPVAKASDMLGSIHEMFIYMQDKGTNDIINIKVPYEAASYLMMSYLELLAKTGR